MSAPEEMQYGRGPAMDGWPNITGKLKRPSGWKLRSDLETLLDSIRTDVGAADSHREKSEWANMLVCIEDAETGFAKLKAALVEVAKSAAPADKQEGAGTL